MILYMITRPENSEDFPRIYRLVKAAFETTPHAEGDEQDFVERQRASDGYIAALSLVTETDNQIVAHLMMTGLNLNVAPLAPGAAAEILLLAAVSVEPEWQNNGIGSGLILDAFERASALGHGAVLVVGDPHFYRRFGFKPSLEYGIVNENRIEDQYVQALELVPGSLGGLTGTVLLPT